MMMHGQDYKNLASGCAQLDNVLVVERCVIYVTFARVSLLASVVDCREGHVAYVCMCVCVCGGRWRFYKETVRNLRGSQLAVCGGPRGM